MNTAHRDGQLTYSFRVEGSLNAACTKKHWFMQPIILFFVEHRPDDQAVNQTHIIQHHWHMLYSHACYFPYIYFRSAIRVISK